MTACALSTAKRQAMRVTKSLNFDPLVSVVLESESCGVFNLFKISYW